MCSSDLIERFDIITETVWTDRGVHFYFNKPKGFRGARCICALGFEIEYKHNGNTLATTVKRNGVARRVANQGIRQELPEYFQRARKYESLVGFDEGDGRDDGLFNHRHKLGSIGNWQKILNYINDFIFAEPLSETDMQRICRDMDVRTDEDDAESRIADIIMDEYDVVKYHGELWWRDGHSFSTEIDGLIRVIYNVVGSQKTRFIDEVVKQLEYRSPLIPDDSTFDIKFNNGILRRGKFIPVEYREFTPYSIDINYKEDAEPVSLVDEYLGLLTNQDRDYRHLVEEIIAHTLIVDQEFKRMVGGFFFFVGDGGNGKGTLLTIIRNILTNKNCSALSIDEMADERYAVTMMGKLVNLGDDVQDKPIDNKQMEKLKNISTCDYISVRRMREQSKDVVLTTSLIFTTNNLLSSFEKGTSYQRRVKWLPMYTKPKKKDPLFITKLTSPEALEYWISLIVKAYMRIYSQGGFTESDIVDQFTASYHKENNTFSLYLEDCTIDDFLEKTSPEVHVEYEEWCIDNGLRVMSPRQVNSTLEAVYGIKTAPAYSRGAGKTQRLYQKIDVEHLVR